MLQTERAFTLTLASEGAEPAAAFRVLLWPQRAALLVGAEVRPRELRRAAVSARRRRWGPTRQPGPPEASGTAGRAAWGILKTKLVSERYGGVPSHPGDWGAAWLRSAAPHCVCRRDSSERPSEPKIDENRRNRPLGRPAPRPRGRAGRRVRAVPALIGRTSALPSGGAEGERGGEGGRVW